MTTPITVKSLEAAVSNLNDLFGVENAQYIGRDETGKLISNVGAFHISGAYGGYRLEQMTQGGGARDVSERGTKREVYDYIWAMVKGAEAMKRLLLPEYRFSLLARETGAQGIFEPRTVYVRGHTLAAATINAIAKNDQQGFESNHVISSEAI